MIMFASLSEDLLMNKNIKSMHMLAPIISLKHQSSSLLSILSNLKDIEASTVRLFDIYEILGYGCLNNLDTGVCAIPIINSIC